MANKLQIGELQIVSLFDTPLAFGLSFFFPDKRQEDFAPYRELYPAAFTPEGGIRSNAQAFAVVGAGGVTLVDAGIGPRPLPWLPDPEARLIDSLAAEDIQTADVSTVLFTHLHDDHIGWSATIDNGHVEPVFPNARYFAPEADWRYFISPEMRAQSTVAAILAPLETLGVLEKFSGEKSFSSGVMAVPTPGHTPGHTSYLVSSGGRQAIITGDLAHHPVQVDHPDWCPPFDSSPQEALNARNQVLDRAESEGRYLCVGHFPFPGLGAIRREGGRRVFAAIH